ncbi:hypothetical protein [Microcystis sp. M158S2]|nr:hypothetical protein [Microcystis sp. M158S2]
MGRWGVERINKNNLLNTVSENTVSENTVSENKLNGFYFGSPI